MLSVNISYYFRNTLRMPTILPHVFPQVSIFDPIDFAHLRRIFAQPTLPFDAFHKKIEIVDYCY